MTTLMLLVLCCSLYRCLAKEAFSFDDHFVNVDKLRSINLFRSNSNINRSSDPSLLDFINILTSGSKGKSDWKNKDTADMLDSMRLPLVKLVSKGEFTIKDINNVLNLNARDIILLEKRSFILTYFCNNILSGIGFVSDESLKYICECPLDTAEISDELSEPLAEIKVTNNYNAKFNSYCARRPCLKEFKNNECSFFVDPWTNAVVLIAKQHSNVEQLMSYRESVPRWTQWALNLKSFINEMKSYAKNPTKIPSSQNQSEDIASSSFLFDSAIGAIDLVRNNILEHIPSYLGNFVLGYIFLAYGDSLMRNFTFQSLLMGSLGLLFSVVILLYIVYRTFEKFISSVTRGTGFGSFGAFAATSSIGYFLVKKSARVVIAFWDDGLCGYGLLCDYKWVGKAFYIVSFILFAWLAQYFQLFNPKIDCSNEGEVIDTLFFKAFSKCISCLGIYLIYNGSSNHVLMVVCLLYILLEEEISDYYRVITVRMSNYTAKGPEYYHGRKLTLQQYDKLGEMTTQRELLKLRHKFISAPDNKQKLTSIFHERGSNTQLDNLRDFCRGTYSGRAHKIASFRNDDDDVDVTEGRSFFSNMKYALLLFIIILYMYVTQEKEKMYE